MKEGHFRTSLLNYLKASFWYCTAATLGLIWFGVWWKTSYEKPSTHPKISAEERDYIEESIGEVDLPPSLVRLASYNSVEKF